MFEEITKFFKKLFKSENEEKTKNAAKERLHLVLTQDRANVSADFLAMMKQEIIEVIKKYIDIDENAIDVRLANRPNEDGTVGSPTLYANIPIISVKDDMKTAIKKENIETGEQVHIDSIENKETEENREEKIELEEEKVETENPDLNKEVIENKEEKTEEEIVSENTENVEEIVEENKEEVPTVIILGNPEEDGKEEPRQENPESLEENIEQKAETDNETDKEEENNPIKNTKDA